MALNKNDIVHSIYTRLDMPKSKSFEVIESLFGAFRPLWH